MSIRSWVHATGLSLIFGVGWIDSMVQAQVVVTQTVSSPAVARASEAAQRAGASSEDQSETDEEKKEPEKPLDERRVEALLEAKVDRSLPTVLKAWSAEKDSDKESKAGDKKKKKTGSKATVANIYEDFVVFEVKKKTDFKKDDAIEIKIDDAVVGKLKILTADDKKLTGKFEPKSDASDADDADQEQTDSDSKSKEPEAESETEAECRDGG